jgi:hypothetical protein
VRGQRERLFRSLGPVVLVLSLSWSAASAIAAPPGSSEFSLKSSPLVSEPDPAPIGNSARGATIGAPASEAVADPEPEESRAADLDPAPEPDLDTAGEPPSLEVEEVAPIPIEPQSAPLPEPDSLEPPQPPEPPSLEVEEVAPIPIEPQSQPLPEPPPVPVSGEPLSLEVEEIFPIPIEPLPTLLPELDSLEIPDQLALGSQPTSWLQSSETIGTVDAAVSWRGREGSRTTSPAPVADAPGGTQPAADRALHPTPTLRVGSLSAPARGGSVTSVTKPEANLQTLGPAVRGGREHATAGPAENGSEFRTPVHKAGTVTALIAAFIHAQQASAGLSSAPPRPRPHQPRAPPGYTSSASLAPAGASSTCQPCSTDRSLRLGRSSLGGWLKSLTVVFTQSAFLSPIERPG